METRTIVIDVDDTISVHNNRDYYNAKPIPEVIEKINSMYDAGWKIILYTARGQVSCNGDLELIQKLRGPILTDWLHRHNVKYHELQFGKPLGVYYVDDKALRPDEFVKLRHELLSGGSGATIERLGDRVIKSSAKTKSEYAWYNSMHTFFVDKLFGAKITIPTINTYYGNTIDMQYIDGESLNDKIKLGSVDTAYKYYNRLIDLCFTFSFDDEVEYDWATMVDRVKEHLECNTINDADRLMKIIDDPEFHYRMYHLASHSHGDLTLENIIVDENDTMYLIDPNRPDGLYSSFIMDLGKLYQSFNGYEEWNGRGALPPYTNRNKEILLQLLEEVAIEFPEIYVAAAIHYVRMLKYKTDQFEKHLAKESITTALDKYEKAYSVSRS